MTQPVRHHGMDRLRIGAFAILILYHIGMVFSPWPYHVKSDHVVRYATAPMLAVNAWRLSLLFVVSGYATRALLGRSLDASAFLKNRSYRLLLPLAFGMAVLVPPQAWVELVTKHGYEQGFLHFWSDDYWSFRPIGGIGLPTWNHLWFLAYLWVYTVPVALGSRLLRRSLQPAFDRAFGGVGVLLIPIAWLIVVHGWWLQFAAETHALAGDWVAHASYLPAFLFGFGLAGSPATMRAIGRWWPAGALLAVAGYAFIVGVETEWIAFRPALVPIYGAAHALEQWGAIMALIGIADRWWNRPAPRDLIEAVFPFYLVHQTIIVVIAWALLGRGLPAAAEFAILVAATVAGCLGFYYGGRSVPWLRPLIGLRRHRPVPRATPALI